MNQMRTEKTRSTSTAVVEAIADHTGTKPEDLPIPLADVVDPDALDHLFHGRDTDGQITFDYDGFTVTVSSRDEVRVTD